MHICNSGQTLIINNFIPKSDRDRILQYAIDHRSSFTNATVSTGDTSYRKALVLHQFPEVKDLVVEPVKRMLPEVCDRLGIDRFEPSQIECQMTVSLNENYFKIHQDNSSGGTNTRKISYVFYIREPGGFEGGNLMLYRSRDSASLNSVVTPTDCSIVFFRSDVWHRVDDVVMTSDDIRLSRLSINGWVRE